MSGAPLAELEAGEAARRRLTLGWLIDLDQRLAWHERLEAQAAAALGITADEARELADQAMRAAVEWSHRHRGPTPPAPATTVDRSELIIPATTGFGRRTL